MDLAYTYLKPIREFLLNGDNRAAQQLLIKHFVAKGRGSGHGHGANVKFGCYQTVGDFLIRWSGDESKLQSVFWI